MAEILELWEQKYKKAEWLSEEALQIAEKKQSEAKGKEEKERYNHLNTEFQSIAGRDNLPKWSMQRNRGKQ